MGDRLAPRLCDESTREISRLRGLSADIHSGTVAAHIRVGDLRGDLSIGEAAAAIGVHKNALRRWSPDLIPYHVVGPAGHRRYRSDDVADYLDRHQHGAREAESFGLRTAARLQQVRETQEVNRALALAARSAELRGDEVMARRLRHTRSIVNERLRVEDS